MSNSQKSPAKARLFLRNNYLEINYSKTYIDKSTNVENSIVRRRLYRYSAISSLRFTAPYGKISFKASGSVFAFTLPNQVFQEIEWTSEELFQLIASIIMDETVGDFEDIGFDILLIYPSKSN